MHMGVFIQKFGPYLGCLEGVHFGGKTGRVTEF